MDFAEFCKQLIDKTDIEKVVSRYVRLSRSGNDLVAPCPFHAETKPSFRVHPDKQYFYCFGCQMGGDVIRFVSEIERIDRIDAIKKLADEAGMELPAFSGGKKSFDKNKRFRLYALMKEAAKHYNENLSSSKANIANTYIKNRNIPDNIVTRFGLGYSIPGDMERHLKSKGFTLDEMKEAGIIAGGAHGNYDVFSERLMFPIINNTGEVVAFGGRGLTENAFPKYRNSAQTELFDKSRTVYGLNLLKKKKLKGGNIDYIIMCEGYMDVIALHKAGFDTAVASMGTALTLNQAKQLKNFTNKIIISYDGDGAGQKATMRGLDILRESGLTVRVAQLPEGLDPDDVINKYGTDAYQNILLSAQSLTEFKLGNIKKKYDLSDPDSRSKYALEAVACIKQLGNPVEIEEYLKQVQEETNYSMDILKQQADLIVEEKKDTPKLSQSIQDMDKETQFVLAAICADKPYAQIDDDLVDIMPTDFTKKVLSSAIDSRLKGIKGVVSALYSDIDQEEHNNLIPILEYKFIDGDDKAKFDGCVNSLKCAALSKRIEELTKEYETEKKLELLVQVKTLSKQLKDLKNGG